MTWPGDMADLLDLPCLQLFCLTNNPRAKISLIYYHRKQKSTNLNQLFLFEIDLNN